MTMQPNLDPQEINKFSNLAANWWDPTGDLKTLHDINPLRLQFILERVSLQEKKVLDVGCGGGILAEGMARQHAIVTGIDASLKAIEIANSHLMESNLIIDYQHTTAEEMAEKHQGEYDIVVCFELLEHVPQPNFLVEACAKLVKPGGQVFFSTINRNPKAYLFAIVGAEYLLKLLPKGTHDYAKFIRPAELAEWSRNSGLNLQDVTGLSYNPLNHQYSLTSDISVNYLAHFVQE